MPWWSWVLTGAIGGYIAGGVSAALYIAHHAIGGL